MECTGLLGEEPKTQVWFGDFGKKENKCPCCDNPKVRLCLRVSCCGQRGCSSNVVLRLQRCENHVWVTVTTACSLAPNELLTSILTAAATSFYLGLKSSPKSICWFLSGGVG